MVASEFNNNSINKNNYSNKLNVLNEKKNNNDHSAKSLRLFDFAIQSILTFLLMRVHLGALSTSLIAPEFSIEQYDFVLPKWPVNSSAYRGKP